MKPRVQFYHNARAPLLFACELIARAHAHRRRITVLLDDEAAAEAFDRELWTFDAASFIPHALHDSPLAARSPVLIAASSVRRQWPHDDVLFHLTRGEQAARPEFRRIIEIVGTSEAWRQPARQRWQQYRQLGCQLEAFDAERRVAL